MTASKFEKLEVGKPYPGDVPRGDSVRVDMTDGGLVAYMVYDGITDKEVQDVRTGEAQFALTVRAGIIFVLMKFGGQPWLDAPYNVHLSQNLTKLVTPGEAQGYGLYIILIDSRTRIVRALRLVGLSHRFSMSLRDAIVLQQAMPYDARYPDKMQQIYQAHTVKDLVSLASVRFKVGKSDEA